METWVRIKEYEDLLFECLEEGIAKITINRPEVRNAFRPQTIMELIDAFELCRADTSIGVVILTGQGPDAFCSGADLKIGHEGYVGKSAPRANILDVQKQIRALPKPVIAMVAGYAIGGGHDCTSCATSLSPRKMRALARRAQGWALLMPDWAAVILRGSWVKREHVRYGFFAASTTPLKR